MSETTPDNPRLLVPVAVGLGLGLVVEVIALFVAMLSGGGGHGDYAAARALFPAAMLMTLLEGDTIGPLSIGLALVQFPLAGALVGYSLARARWTPLIAVGVVHVLCLLVAFSGAIPNFS